MMFNSRATANSATQPVDPTDVLTAAAGLYDMLHEFSGGETDCTGRWLLYSTTIYVR